MSVVTDGNAAATAAVHGDDDAALRALADRLRAGERRALARAITMAESTRADHRARARALAALLAAADGPPALRLGLSGAPGVGKSTFIEALGMKLVDRGLRVAVLAVDPSSARSGGSILGDKTRMDRLGKHPNAFIRPSPSGGGLGGVARRTRECILLAEAAGHDVVIVETVGVGQSETMVADMTDVFALLVGPGGGDELQGVKRGIMELADLILVNKADGDLAAAAARTVADYAGALRLLRRRPHDPAGWPRALPVSALAEAGLDAAWDAVEGLHRARVEAGWLQARRSDQAVRWFRFELEQGLAAAFRADAAVAAALPAAEAQVAAGETPPEAAAQALLAAFLRARDGR
jgi:LAO/AO transport system kinase